MTELDERIDDSMTWARIVRIGLVQASIGAVVVMLTSTVNRVMIVELALPAVIPGLLIALHFAIQFTLRPRLGHRSDLTGRREWWIVGGLGVLALSGTGAAASAAWIASDRSLARRGAVRLPPVADPLPETDPRFDVPTVPPYRQSSAVAVRDSSPWPKYPPGERRQPAERGHSEESEHSRGNP